MSLTDRFSYTTFLPDSGAHFSSVLVFLLSGLAALPRHGRSLWMGRQHAGRCRHHRSASKGRTRQLGAAGPYKKEQGGSHNICPARIKFISLLTTCKGIRISAGLTQMKTYFLSKAL